MKILGSICAIIIAIFIIIWLYRKILIAKKYTKTIGEIIDVKNIVPLVDKRKQERLFPLAFKWHNYTLKKPQIEYIPREQDENRGNTSKIGQTTCSTRNNDGHNTDNF